jgi:sugar lactone lactonase YvrE
MTGGGAPAPAPEPAPADPRDGPVSPWSDRLELGEGARWVDGRLVLVDLLAGRLLADDPGAQDPDADHTGTRRGGRPLTSLAWLPVPLGAVAPIQGAPDVWIAAAGTGVCIIAPDVSAGGDVTWIGHVEHDADAPAGIEMRVNDAVADADGRLWFGTMAYDATADAGSLYRVEYDGTITRVLNRITIPNGPAFTEDGSTMYLADSARGLVRRYELDRASGALGAPALFADFADVAGGPDGMTVDREGGVWIANWGGSAVHRYLPDGTLDRVIELPAAQPASVCLGGEDGRLLHITTAGHELNPPGPQDGAVFTIRVDVPGFAATGFRAEGRVAAIVERHRADPGTRQARPGEGAGR